MATFQRFKTMLETVYSLVYQISFKTLKKDLQQVSNSAVWIDHNRIRTWSKN